MEGHMASDMGYPEERGSGWIAFAGIMLMLSGSVSFLQGLWALDHKSDAAAKVSATQLSYGNLETWGWIVLIWGIIVFLAGIAIFVRSQFARWVGIIAASISLLLSFLWVFAFPIAAFTVMFIDFMVLYALFAYGGRESTV
jgi:hypothetical protein